MSDTQPINDKIVPALPKPEPALPKPEPALPKPEPALPKPEPALPAVAMMNPSLDRIQSFVVKARSVSSTPRNVIDVTGLSM